MHQILPIICLDLSVLQKVITLRRVPYVVKLKKIASISLLILLSFNWVGYRLLTDFLDTQATAKLQIELDQEDYKEADLLEVRVPLELPYQTDWKDFERFDGEVEINGVHYKYVKRKVEDGQMVLLCIPNKGRMDLQTARDNFFRLVNDLQHPGQGKDGKSSSTNIFKGFNAEYFQEKNQWTIFFSDAPHFEFQLRNEDFLSFDYSNAPVQPPDC